MLVGRSVDSEAPALFQRQTSPRLDVLMQDTLNRLNISLKVVWEPLVSSGRHGEIKDGCLLIYDREENDVWSTFVHEIVEYRLKEVTRVHRQLINSLIEGYESLAYSSKEKFIDSLPSIFEAVAAARDDEAPVASSRLTRKHGTR